MPFYTGRFVIETEEVGKDLLTREDPYYILIRDKRGGSETKLLSSGKLYPLLMQFMGSDRVLALFSNHLVQNTITIGEAPRKDIGSGKRSKATP